MAIDMCSHHNGHYAPLGVMVAIGVHCRWALHQLCKVIWFMTSCANLLHEQTKNFGKRLVNLEIAGHSTYAKCYASCGFATVG